MLKEFKRKSLFVMCGAVFLCFFSSGCRVLTRGVDKLWQSDNYTKKLWQIDNYTKEPVQTHEVVGYTLTVKQDEDYMGLVTDAERVIFLPMQLNNDKGPYPPEDFYITVTDELQGKIYETSGLRDGRRYHEYIHGEKHEFLNPDTRYMYRVPPQDKYRRGSPVTALPVKEITTIANDDLALRPLNHQLKEYETSHRNILVAIPTKAAMTPFTLMVDGGRYVGKAATYPFVMLILWWVGPY